MRESTQGLVNLPEAVFNINRERIIEFARQNRIPVMCSDPRAIEIGCLMSYGPNQLDIYRRGAIYIDKILKGARPGDLPIEQPTKFDFVINLRTAKEIGVTIAPKLLARADKVIK